MATTLDLITKALRRSGAIGAHDTPDADEANDALDSLNDMLESWANESLMVFARTEEIFPLTGAQEYTVGQGADFNTIPFIEIIAMYARQSTIDYPMTALTDSDYYNIPFKSTANTPEYYNYNNGYPEAKLKLYPAPSASYTLHVLSEKPLASLTLNQTISLPPGWRKAIITNLAVEECPSYGIEPTPTLSKQATESKNVIKGQVSRAKTMDWPKKTVGSHDIYSGWYN